jgi:hypothetical protein
MAKAVKLAFERRTRVIPVKDMLPLKRLPPDL